MMIFDPKYSNNFVNIDFCMLYSVSSQDLTGNDIRALYSFPVESCELTL